MHHVAIMKPSWKLIPKILAGEKTIESRWYKMRRAPWDKAKKGDIIYFKNSGQAITAKAEIAEVLQFELKDMNDAKHILKDYGKEICVVNANPEKWPTIPRYCVLLRLKNPQAIRPFTINKKGFGSAAAWLTVNDITKIIDNPRNNEKVGPPHSTRRT